MMIYRSLVVGLLGAIAMLIAAQSQILERNGRAHAVELAVAGDDEPRAVDEDAVTIVHISRSATGDDPAAALGLGWHERAVAIDDASLGAHWRDVLRARWHAARPGSYFELAIDGAVQRRMLVLVTR